MLEMAAVSRYHQTANGTNTHYVESGNPNGPLIVLLHGLGGSIETFTALIPKLHPDVYRIIGVDLEGLGKTPLSSPDVVLSIPRYIDTLESLITFLQGHENNSPKVVLIGHSLGGIIATQYAARHPNNIQGLALLGSGRSIASIPPARKRMLSLAAKTRADGIIAAADAAAISNLPLTGGASPALPGLVWKAVSKSDPEGYARTCEAIAGLDHVDPDYTRIIAPTLLLAGSGDVISPPERSHAIKQLIGDNAWVTVLDGVGHQFIMQDLQGCVGALEELFERMGGR